MVNEFLEIMNNPLFRSAGVIRYSTTYQARPESLNDHVVDVMTMSYMIARKLIVLGEKIDMGLLMVKGLVHDSLDEPLIGDIPRLTKYATKECHTELSKVADLVADKVSSKIDGTTYSYDVWSNAKDRTIEGVLIKITDMLSVAKKATMEVELLHNLFFLKVIDEVSEYLDGMANDLPDVFLTDAGKEYVIQVLRDAYTTTHTISEANYGLTRKYGMYDDITSYIVNHGIGK